MPTTPADELELIDDLLVEWNATPRAKANSRVTVAAFARWLDARGTSPADATQADCQAWLDQRAGEVKASRCAFANEVFTRAEVVPIHPLEDLADAQRGGTSSTQPG
jgi:hypothetical protein